MTYPPRDSARSAHLSLHRTPLQILVAASVAMMLLVRPSPSRAEESAPPPPPTEAPPVKTASLAGPAHTEESVRRGLGAKHRRSKGKAVNLNFVDADLVELVRAVSLATGKRFIIGPKVRALKASIFSPGPVSSAEAYQAFLSVLASEGLTVVPAGRYLKIAESDEARTSAIPLCLDGEECAGGDRMVTRLHRLRHVGAEEMTQVLASLVSEHGTVTGYVPTNTLIVTEYARNLRRLLRLVQELDVSASGARIWVEPVHHAAAEEMATLLDEIFESGETTTAKTRRDSPPAARKRGTKATAAKATSPTTVGAPFEGERPRQIIADGRTNQLVIVGSERSYLMVIELLRALDDSLGDDDGEARVHTLEHADAEELAATLQSLAKSSGRTPSKSRRGKAASPGAASLFDGEMQITADKGTNSLVIVGSGRDYASLREVIDSLDRERQQVFVEAVIMEVSVDGNKRLGVAFHGGVSEDGDDGTTTSIFGTAYDGGSLNSLVLDPSTLQGLALGVQGPSAGIDLSDIIPGMPAGISLPSFGVVLQALQDSSDVNVISTPHILAMDNEEAELQVGQNVPVSTSYTPGLSDTASLLSGDSTSAASAASALFSGVSMGRETVGVQLGLTPHINTADEVRLEVDLEVSEITGESSLLPEIGQRTLKTSCVVQDQQTVVLGGLVSDRVIEGVEKVPILGDIPLLGKLFQRTHRIMEKRNLLIFLTPYIVRDSSDFRRIFTRKMQERRDFIDRFTAFEYHEVQPHLDYERTNGLFEEIRQSVEEVDEETARQALLAAEEEPTHEPRRPIAPPSSVPTGGAVLGQGEEVVDARGERARGG